MKRLYTLIFDKIMGWKICGQFNAEIKKCVVIIVPHTSWFDFIIGLLVRGIVGFEINYVAKKELFRFPFGWYFRWMGGTPLDRSGGKRKVDAIAEIFRSKSEYRLAIAPEGTRKRVETLKTGFYYIALQAGVPIIPVSFDYPSREVRIGAAYYPTGEIDLDLPIIEKFFAYTTGKISHFSFKPHKKNR